MHRAADRCERPEKWGGHMAEENKENQAKSAKEQQSSDDQAYALPKIDFSTFVLSMNSSALVQLGLIDDPATGQRAKNLPLAKQTIDMLVMLEEKTKRNLTDDEEKILTNILYELRMLYVKATSE
jgi:hypothetical protein